MTQRSTIDRPRELTTTAYVLTGLLAAFMFLLAVRGYSAPESAARGFGIPLAAARDDAFLYIKAGRDLSLGVMLVGLMLAGRRAPIIIMIAATLIIPLNDCLQVIARGDLGYALGVHGSAVAYGLVVLAVLLRARRATPIPA